MTENEKSLIQDLRSFQQDLSSVLVEIGKRHKEKEEVILEIASLRKQISEAEKVRHAQLGLLLSGKEAELNEIKTKIAAEILRKKSLNDETDELSSKVNALKTQITVLQDELSSIESHVRDLILQNASLNSSIAASQHILLLIKESILTERNTLTQVGNDVVGFRKEIVKIRDTKKLEQELDNRESAIIKREGILSEKEGRMASTEEKIMFIYKKLTEKNGI